MPQQPLAQVPVDAVWDWQEHGACRSADPTLFFHPQNERGSARRSRDLAAKAVCASCPVRIECADYAVRARVANVMMHVPYDSEFACRVE